MVANNKQDLQTNKLAIMYMVNMDYLEKADIFYAGQKENKE